ncbi:hypothetical protein KQI65_16030 [bacterium]|nr:hypothetical protein [bacterium]
MTQNSYVFPFGQPVRTVEQVDRTPKRAFVLGVYASAVHARWIGPDDRSRINALAVASEPEIFWTGEDARVKPAEIISSIELPDGSGRLEPAASNLNGPSGRSLDKDILEPLGLSRSDTWLCDCVPHACMNPRQKDAVSREYDIFPLTNLTPYRMPPPPTKMPEGRRDDILDEVLASEAELLILLGDRPLEWFVSTFPGGKKRLVEYAPTKEEYGNRHPFSIGSHHLEILPLAHPRQIAGLGITSGNWKKWHTEWKRRIIG